MQRLQYIRNKALPCFILPAIIGAVTGALIFLFKVVSLKIILMSEKIYEYVRENPIYFTVLIIGAFVIGLISSLILNYAKECRGGGIPTAIASIRGLVPIKWIQGIFVLFVSALLTYLAGVPLGNEGPSVQMGTAVGKGSSEILYREKRAWERYIMTGGACAGFATATGAPLSGIMFALEETHRRFSPMIFIVAAVSVLTGTVTQELLSALFKVDTTFFDFTISEILPLRYFWVALVIGAVCALCAMMFTAFYNLMKRIRENKLVHIPFFVKISVIFLVTAVFGFLSEDFVGSGHSLIEKIMCGESVWYIILLAFILRAVLMISANSEGVSGGIFVPTLTFGAIIAALLSYGLIAANIIDGQYFGILIAVGMSSFLSASARTPITALTFAAEALCGAGNLLPVGIGVVISYLIVEISGRPSFTDTVIEAKIEKEHTGKTPIIIDTHMIAMPNSFAVGMEIRDILWPPTCTVLSVDKKSSDIIGDVNGISAGDILHLHYQTYDPEQTAEILTDILGDQEYDDSIKMHLGSDEHIVPLD